MTARNPLVAVMIALAMLLAAALVGRPSADAASEQRTAATRTATQRSDPASAHSAPPDDDRGEPGRPDAPALRSRRPGAREAGTLPRGVPRSPHRGIQALAPITLTAAPRLADPLLSPRWKADPTPAARRSPERAGPCSAADRCVALQVYRC